MRHFELGGRTWSRRFNLAHTMFQRAVQRGELPAGVDLDLALDLLIGPLYLRLLVTGESLDLDLAERVVGLVLNGLAGNRPEGPGS